MKLHRSQPQLHRWRPGQSDATHPADQEPGARSGWGDRRRATFAVAVAAVVAGLGWLMTSQLRRTSETVYTPFADTYVSTAHPEANYGNTPALRVDATPKIRSYLRFRLDGSSGRIVKAELRLWSRSGSLTGYSVHPVPDRDWGELGITSRNGPAVEASVATSGPFGPETWTSTDVTRLVAGTDEVSVALTTKSAENMTFDTREGSHEPQLVVRTAFADRSTG